MASWAVTPMLRWTAGASRTTSWPATQADPASGMDSVVRMRTAVVLPAPFGPSTPRMEPVGRRGPPRPGPPSRRTLRQAFGPDHGVGGHGILRGRQEFSYLSDGKGLLTGCQVK